MNLRTIKCWVIYDPANKQVIASRRFKHEIERLRIPAHWKLVELKGHYVRKAKP